MSSFCSGVSLACAVALVSPLCAFAKPIATISDRLGFITPTSVALRVVRVPAADGVVLKPRFVTSQKLTYTLISTIEIPRPNDAHASSQAPEAPVDPKTGGDRRTTQDKAGEDRQPVPMRSFRMEATLKLTTLGTDEQGNAAMLMRFSSLRSELSTDGKRESELTLSGSDEDHKQENKEENKPSDSGQAPPPAAVPDDAPLGVVTRVLMASIIRIDVQPDGSISEITGLEDAHATAAQHPDGARLLGPFAPGVATRSLAAFFRIDAPDKTGKFTERNEADTWTLTDEWPIGSSSTMTRTNTCTLESLAPELAKIAATAEAAIKHKNNQPDEPQTKPGRGTRQPDTSLEPRILITEQSDTSTIEWNPAQGVLVARVRESSMTTKARLGTHKGEPQQVRSRIEVRLVK